VIALAADGSERSCHIHPPGEDRNPGAILGPFSREGCEEANRIYFGGAGRCHCIAEGFGTDWFFPFPPAESARPKSP
jgi:hypothetical protein